MNSKNNPAEIQFRLMQEGDIEALCVLVQPLVSPSFNWSTEKLKSQLGNLATKTFVFGAGQILGFACFVELGEVVEIPVLAVSQANQGKGLMGPFLKAVIAAHYESKELWLEVHVGNQRARNLYRTLGFVESGSRLKYYEDGSAAILCNRFPTRGHNI